MMGGWVEFRDPELTPERLRRPLIALAARGAAVASRLDAIDESKPETWEAVSDDDMSIASKFNDLAVMCVVTAWSFEAPVTVDGLLDLPGPVYDAVVKHTLTLLPRLMPSFAVNPDPKALSGS